MDKLYIGNAFSMSMLPAAREAAVSTYRISVAEATEILKGARKYGDGYVSCVGHADTAALFTAILGVPVETHRVSVTLEVTDEIIVGQYSGPRLPEGATTLPAGSRIDWFRVFVVAPVRTTQEQADALSAENARMYEELKTLRAEAAARRQSAEYENERKQSASEWLARREGQ